MTREKLFEVKCPKCGNFIKGVDIKGTRKTRIHGCARLVKTPHPYSYSKKRLHCFGCISGTVYEEKARFTCPKCFAVLKEADKYLDLDDARDFLKTLVRKEIKRK